MVSVDRRDIKRPDVCQGNISYTITPPPPAWTADIKNMQAVPMVLAIFLSNQALLHSIQLQHRGSLDVCLHFAPLGVKSIECSPVISQEISHFWKYSNRHQQPCHSQSCWDLHSNIWALTKSLDLYLHVFIHCTSAIWLDDWTTAWITRSNGVLIKWVFSVAYCNSLSCAQ